MNRHILFILDRSGSMAMVRGATISGFNEYVTNLKRDDPDATFQLTLFDTEGIDTAESRKARAVELLTDKTYEPRANTPLWDAVGKTVSESQDNADTAYLVVILTDGLENSSHEWDRKKLADLLEKKRASGRWTFAYLGSNQDAWHEAAQFGGTAGSTATVGASAASQRAAYSTTSQATRRWGAAAAQGLSGSTPDFYGGIRCQDCGQEMEPNKTHVCPKAVKP